MQQSNTCFDPNQNQRAPQFYKNQSVNSRMNQYSPINKKPQPPITFNPNNTLQVNNKLLNPQKYNLNGFGNYPYSWMNPRIDNKKYSNFQKMHGVNGQTYVPPQTEIVVNNAVYRDMPKKNKINKFVNGYVPGQFYQEGTVFKEQNEQNDYRRTEEFKRNRGLNMQNNNQHIHQKHTQNFNEITNQGIANQDFSQQGVMGPNYLVPEIKVDTQSLLNFPQKPYINTFQNDCLYMNLEEEYLHKVSLKHTRNKNKNHGQTI